MSRFAKYEGLAEEDPQGIPYLYQELTKEPLVKELYDQALKSRTVNAEAKFILRHDTELLKDLGLNPRQVASEVADLFVKVMTHLEEPPEVQLAGGRRVEADYLTGEYYDDFIRDLKRLYTYLDEICSDYYDSQGGGSEQSDGVSLEDDYVIMALWLVTGDLLFN